MTFCKNNWWTGWEKVIYFRDSNYRVRNYWIGQMGPRDVYTSKGIRSSLAKLELLR
jgi:hypothetical protein